MGLSLQPISLSCGASKAGELVSLTTSYAAYLALSECIESEVEEFWIIALNSNLEIIKRQMLFRGTANLCMIHPRDIIKFLCVHNACHYFIAHNHPSGDPRPSTEDRKITQQLKRISKLIEISMIDHLILSKNCYFSFAEKKVRRLKSLSGLSSQIKIS